MKRVALLLPLVLLAVGVSAEECDCSTYPFKPNPPCYSACVAKLSSAKEIDLSSVKNIDQEVYRAIKAIAASKNRHDIDFNNITGKAALKREAVSLDLKY